MKRIALLVTCISLTLCALAQTQQGYVKTIGKPGKKGVALSGVTVRAKGNHNAVVSKSNGQFTMKMKGLKNGDAYSLQQVQKNGYELNDAGTIGRQYAFSATVPLTIVMVSTAQLQADIQRIENNAYAVAEKNYKAKMAKLEKQLNENTITAEEYRTALQDLQNSFEKYQSLIESLAEHYAHTDYDMLDENEAKINTLIENGELEKADSLIHTLFDPIDVLKRNKEALDRLDQTIADAQGMIDQANTDMAAVLKQQEKDAEYLYQLYTIALAQFDNERAAKYIQTRAELDTTNVEWQNDAGQFIKDYLGDYPLAMEYYQRGLRQAQKEYGELSEWCATCYSNIANLYRDQSQFDKALELHYKALHIRQFIFGDEHENTGESYNAIGLSYHFLNNYDSAFVYYMKAINIISTENEKNYPLLSSIYDNLGTFYFDKGEYNTAIEYLNKAIDIDETIYGTESLHTVVNYNNLSRIYVEIRDDEKAFELMNKSLMIREKILGNNHPQVATALTNLAGFYLNKKEDDKALPLFLKALEIRKTVFGDMSPKTATIYQYLGSIYNHKGNYTQSIDYQLKALAIFEKEFGNTNQNTLVSYNYLGLVYKEIKDYDKAIEYFTKALNAIVEITGNPEHKYVITFYHNIGDAYYNKGDDSKALEYSLKAKDISEKNYGKDFPLNAFIYNSIGLILHYQGNYDQAMEYYTNALSISKDDYLKALLYSNMGKVYEKLEDYHKAIEYYNMSYDLHESLYGPEHPDTQSIKNSIELATQHIQN